VAWCDLRDGCQHIEMDVGEPPKSRLGGLFQSGLQEESSWSIKEYTHIGIPDCARYFTMLR
jgi:hypothetical protein